MTKDVEQYRAEVLTSLKYIEEKISSIDIRLDTLNNRVRKAEVSIGWIKGIGSTFMVIVTTIMAIFKTD